MQRMKPASEFEDMPTKHSSSAVVRALVLFAGALGAAFILGAVFSIWLYVQQVQNGYRLANLQNEYEQLVTVQRKLRLEWSRFQDPHHLEELGQNNFGLNPPRSDQKLSVP
jgi:hypothetical protein